MLLPLTVFQKLAESRCLEVLSKLPVFLEIILQTKNVLKATITLVPVLIQLILVGSI